MVESNAPKREGNLAKAPLLVIQKNTD